MIYGLQMGCCLGGRSIEEGIKTYQEITDRVGLQGVELDFSYSPPDSKYGIRPRLLPSEINEEIKKKLLDFLKPFKIKGAHLPWAYIEHIAEEQKVQSNCREKIKLGIQKASELSLDFVTIHLDSQRQGISEDEKWKMLKEATIEYLACSQKYRVILTLETTDNIEPLTKIINEINDPYLKLTLDIGHSFPSIKETKYKTIENYIKVEREILKNIHLHDHNLIRDHLPPGKGVINFHSFIHTLIEIDYQGNISMEFEPAGLEELIESIKFLKSLEKNSLGYGDAKKDDIKT